MFEINVSDHLNLKCTTGCVKDYLFKLVHRWNRVISFAACANVKSQLALSLNTEN